MQETKAERKRYHIKFIAVVALIFLGVMGSYYAFKYFFFHVGAKSNPAIQEFMKEHPQD